MSGLHKWVGIVLVILLFSVSVFSLIGVVYWFKPGLLCSQATLCPNRDASFEWGLLAPYVLAGVVTGSVFTLPLVAYAGIRALKRFKRSETR